jgi:hypothetical protein
MAYGRYQHPQFHILQSMAEIPPIPEVWPGEGCEELSRVAVAISLGATAIDVLSLNGQFPVIYFFKIFLKKPKFCKIIFPKIFLF